MLTTLTCKGSKQWFPLLTQDKELQCADTSNKNMRQTLLKVSEEKEKTRTLAAMDLSACRDKGRARPKTF